MVEVVVVVEEGVENRSFAPRVLPPRGNTATAWLDKDKRKEERERDDEESYESSPYVIVRKRGMKNRVRQFRTMGTGHVEDLEILGVI